MNNDNVGKEYLENRRKIFESWFLDFVKCPKENQMAVSAFLRRDEYGRYINTDTYASFEAFLASDYYRGFADQWLSTEDRLPSEDNQEILIMVDGQPRIARFSKAFTEDYGIPVADFDFNHVDGYEYSANFTAFIYWQPLPLPDTSKKFLSEKIFKEGDKVKTSSGKVGEVLIADEDRIKIQFGNVMQYFFGNEFLRYLEPVE